MRRFSVVTATLILVRVRYVRRSGPAGHLPDPHVAAASVAAVD